MPKYSKTNWIDGETILKAKHMQKIEQGIVDLYNEIENVVIGNVDLSKYATTEYVNEEISNISNKVNEIDELMHQLTNNRTIDGGEL